MIKVGDKFKAGSMMVEVVYANSLIVEVELTLDTGLVLKNHTLKVQELSNMEKVN